jgi:hypothetical protein
VTYRAEFHPSALTQLQGAPWDTQTLDREQIRIFDVTWIG